MAPPPSDRRPSRTGYEFDSDAPPSDDDKPATRQELRHVVKRIERLEPLRGHFAELQNDFAMHRANIKADITGSVRAAVSEQIGPMKETVEEARGILLEQEARAKVMAEHRAETERQRAEAERQRSDEAKEKEARRKSRTAMLVGVSPIIVALIAAWSAWVAMRAPQPQQPPQQHIEAK